MKPTVKPVALAVGAALAGTVMLAQTTTAAENPFSVNELNSGYMQPVFSYFSNDEANTQNTNGHKGEDCLLYTSPSPRDLSTSRMPSSA